MCESTRVGQSETDRSVRGVQNIYDNLSQETRVYDNSPLAQRVLIPFDDSVKYAGGADSASAGAIPKKKASSKEKPPIAPKPKIVNRWNTSNRSRSSEDISDDLLDFDFRESGKSFGSRVDSAKKNTDILESDFPVTEPRSDDQGQDQLIKALATSTLEPIDSEEESESTDL